MLPLFWRWMHLSLFWRPSLSQNLPNSALCTRLLRNMSHENEGELRFPAALQNDKVTILAFGALLSESSSRLTFPDLRDFRLVLVRNFRRVFAHPHLFLVSNGLVDPSQTLNLASLSAEPSDRCSFVAASFSVKLDDSQRRKFLQREEEYNITSVRFYNLEDDANPNAKPIGEGVICLASTDAEIPESILGRLPSSLPYQNLWHWPEDSGLLPADIYLRHCLLAVEKAGNHAMQSFLHDTYLVDRNTSLATYLEKNRDRVMASRPPPELATRFGG